MDDLQHAQTAVAALLADFAIEDWTRDSPCDEWDVAGVVRHLVVGERAFTTSLGGSSYDLPALTAEVATIPNTDLPAAYAEGAARLREALAAADPEGAYPTGLGPMPAPAVDQLRTIEALVHGWDAGRGVGRLLVVDEDVAERAITHSLALMERLPPERTPHPTEDARGARASAGTPKKPFGPPQPVADDARALDRLAALLGRDVNG